MALTAKDKTQDPININRIWDMKAQLLNSKTIRN